MKVLLVYPHVAHYREDVLRALEADPRIDLTIAASNESLEPGIATIQVDSFESSVRLTNWSRGGVVWQRGAVLGVMRSRADAVVFVGAAAYLSTWVAATLARLMGKDVLFWTIGWHRPDVGVRRRVRLAFYRLADTLLLYGQWGAAIGHEMGYPLDRIVVVGNSVSTPSKFANEVKPDLVELAGCEVILGAVIRLTPVKNLTEVIRAASELRRRGVTCGVLLGGDGPEREKLQQLAYSLDVPLVITGPVYSKAALEFIYSELTLTVVPGAVGLTAIQSLHHGVPVVTMNDWQAQMPEAEAVHDGKTGFTFAVADQWGVVDAISRYLKLDAAERAVMERSCIAEAARWTPQATADAIVGAISADRRGA